MGKAIFLFCVAILLMLAACNRTVKGKNGVTYINAVSYNDYIVNRQIEVKKLGSKVSAENKTDMNKAEQTLNAAIVLIDKDITDIEGMPDWKGDTALRNSALSLFRFYKSVFSNNYRQIIAVQKDGTLSEEEKEGVIYLMGEANKAEDLLDARFQKAQQNFSSKNGVLIPKNELQNKIDSTSK